LENVGISLKLPFGPIISPKPGPTLEIDVAAPDIDVIKFKPEKDNKIAIIKKIKIKIIKTKSQNNILINQI